MAKSPSMFARICSRFTRAGKKVKFATPSLAADLTKLIPAPPKLLQRLGIKSGYVQEGKRPSVRSIIVTKPAIRKAELERKEGRPLKRVEVKEIKTRLRYISDYLKEKVRRNPNLADRSLYPPFWTTHKAFEENWMTDHRRFLRLAQERTGFRYELDGATGEWKKTAVPGAARRLMSDAD
jgi:hypothetical protein